MLEVYTRALSGAAFLGEYCIEKFARTQNIRGESSVKDVEILLAWLWPIFFCRLLAVTEGCLAVGVLGLKLALKLPLFIHMVYGMSLVIWCCVIARTGSSSLR